MKIARLRQPALSAVAVLLISGAGIAFAGNTPSPAVPAAVPTAVPTVQTGVPAVEPIQAAGADTDTLQEGDQTTPDSPPAAGTEAVAAEASGTEQAGTEKAGTEAPGDATLPGGGHADDPNNATADHQFEGAE